MNTWHRTCPIQRCFAGRHTDDNKTRKHFNAVCLLPAPPKLPPRQKSPSLHVVYSISWVVHKKHTSCLLPPSWKLASPFVISFVWKRLSPPLGEPTSLLHLFSLLRRTSSLTTNLNLSHFTLLCNGGCCCSPRVRLSPPRFSWCLFSRPLPLLTHPSPLGRSDRHGCSPE